jgi:hypothetical protein
MRGQQLFIQILQGALFVPFLRKGIILHCHPFLLNMLCPSFLFSVNGAFLFLYQINIDAH